VLNGSRFKVRFDQSTCYGILLLSGVKCLPNDPNFPDYQKFSNLALQFSRQNLLQRDVDIELESVDKKGIFHGHIFLSKQNYSLRLLENGLGVTYNPLQQNRYSVVFEDAENRASQRKDGLWGIKNLNLSVIRGDEE
jgi:staphylococcal nuclease domain-containing protein 1